MSKSSKRLGLRQQKSLARAKARVLRALIREWSGRWFMSQSYPQSPCGTPDFWHVRPNLRLVEPGRGTEVNRWGPGDWYSRGPDIGGREAAVCVFNRILDGYLDGGLTPSIELFQSVAECASESLRRLSVAKFNVQVTFGASLTSEVSEDFETEAEARRFAGQYNKDVYPDVVVTMFRPGEETAVVL